MRGNLIFAVCLPLAFSGIAARSQSLYMPRNVRQAFLNGTRSADGFPGKNYWQNRARYDIHVTALPPDRKISGSEQITYFNQSPDTLKTLVFKLIQNIHIPGAIRFGDADSDYFNNGVHVDSFLINGKREKWVTNPGHFTWQEIRLTDPLIPGDSIHLYFRWHYRISLKSGREGMIDSTTYYLAYFYPRVAVYDDYYGWDRMNFTGEQEFYNDFNDYTLKVSVPENYLVWATGMLQNPAEVLQPVFASKLDRSMHTSAVIHIATPSDLASKQITLQKAINTWIFTASHITDMAIGLSDHYDWDASSLVVDEAKERRVSIQAAYNDRAADFHHAVKIGSYSVNWYSHHWPGVPFPFPKMTVL
ncbi:MAG TPA: hypothetical protein VNE41_00305 [Chitinophagaceae bacterium]|nr:hypothetical protein [Chitinophagaceae bacterium]